MKQILYSDLDKTLLINEDGQLKVSKQNIDAVKEFVSKGNLFGIATGRNILQTKSFVKDLLPYINLPFVVGNGSLLYDAKTNEKIFESLIPKEFLLAFLSFYKTRNDFILVLATSDDYLVLMPDQFDHLPVVDFPSTLINEVDIFNYSINKVMAYINPLDFEVIEKDIRNFIAPFNMNLEPSEKKFIEIINANIDKASGITEAIKYLGLKTYELNTIGDFYNDISMLKLAHYSAAPSDADKRVKEIVDYIVKPHDKGAVSDFINIILKR